MRWWTLVAVLVVINGFSARLHAGYAIPGYYGWYLVISYVTPTWNPFSALPSTAASPGAGSFTVGGSEQLPLYRSNVTRLPHNRIPSSPPPNTVIFQLDARTAQQINSGQLDQQSFAADKLRNHLAELSSLPGSGHKKPDVAPADLRQSHGPWFITGKLAAIIRAPIKAFTVMGASQSSKKVKKGSSEDKKPNDRALAEQFDDKLLLSDHDQSRVMRVRAMTHSQAMKRQASVKKPQHSSASETAASPEPEEEEQDLSYLKALGAFHSMPDLSSFEDNMTYKDELGRRHSAAAALNSHTSVAFEDTAGAEDIPSSPSDWDAHSKVTRDTVLETDTVTLTINMSVNGKALVVNDSLRSAIKRLLVEPGGATMKASEFYRFPVQFTDLRSSGDDGFLLHTMDVVNKQNNTLADLAKYSPTKSVIALAKDGFIKEQEIMLNNTWNTITDDNTALQQRLGDYCNQNMFFPLYNALHQSVATTNIANKAMIECLLDIDASEVIPLPGNGIYLSDVERLSEQAIHVSTVVSYNQLMEGGKIHGRGKQLDRGDPMLSFEKALAEGNRYRSRLARKRGRNPQLHNTSWRTTAHIMEMRVEYIIARNSSNQWTLQGVLFYYDLNSPSSVKLKMKATADEYQTYSAFDEMTHSHGGARNSVPIQTEEPDAQTEALLNTPSSTTDAPTEDILTDESSTVDTVEAPTKTARTFRSRATTWSRMQQTSIRHRRNVMAGTLIEDYPENLSDSDED